MVSALPESMRRSIVKGRLAGKRGGDARLRNGCPLNLVPEGFNFFLVSLRDRIFPSPFALFLWLCGSIVMLLNNPLSMESFSSNRENESLPETK